MSSNAMDGPALVAAAIPAAVVIAVNVAVDVASASWWVHILALDK